MGSNAEPTAEPPAAEGTSALPDEPPFYEMKISRLTVDKLGVKLYDKVSAVVAELIANSYDADATDVRVNLPLGTELASKGEAEDKGYVITVTDDGHGMTPSEAQRYFLIVGADRRVRDGSGRSRHKQRLVMGRKGIGKLAPFGICRRIEVISSGGDKTTLGYRTSHFILDFDQIVRDEDTPVRLDTGRHDKSWRPEPGTQVILSSFLPKRVPAQQIFVRQVARRFALAADDFTVSINDTRSGGVVSIPKFQIALNEITRIDVANRPVPLDSAEMPVQGWLAFAKDAYRDEEEAGVRIYARGKIVATTRDFEQPAGFTGEFTARSYLVGEIHAEWLDEDDEDLVRTDRQGILWDSEKGDALRTWGMGLIREIAKKSAGPRREKKSSDFLQKSRLEERARERYSDSSVVDAAKRLGTKIGAFASEDELRDPDYVNGLADVILSVAPHQALIEAFREISGQEGQTIDELLELFGKTRIAEMASYAQIARERVQSIQELRSTIDDEAVSESALQNLIAGAPWLIRPDWSVISENQSLKLFRDRFAVFWRERYGDAIDIAISYEKKRPDFTLVHIGRKLHIVELKKPRYTFGDDDYGRLENYLVAFEDFFEDHQEFAAAFPDGWQITLIADDVKIKDQTKRLAFRSALTKGSDGGVVRISWFDFLLNATTAHEQFLDAFDRANQDNQEAT